MAEYFNKKSGLSGSVPLGSFNSMFSFTGSSKNDAAVTKALALDGYFVPLFEVKLTSSELVLREDVKRAIPYSWDPSSLARLVGNRLVCTRNCGIIICYIFYQLEALYVSSIVSFLSNCQYSSLCAALLKTMVPTLLLL